MYSYISDTYRDFRAALGCLIWLDRRPGEEASPARLARATLFFPVVGLCIGAVAAVVNAVLLPVVPDVPRMALIVLLLSSPGRGRALRGLAHSAGEPWAGSGGPGRSARLAGWRLAGWTVCVSVLLLKLLALSSTRPPLRSTSLLLAPILGRWALVVVAHGSRPVRRGVGSGLVVGRVTFREFGWSSVLAFGLALALADAVGLVAVVSAALASTALRLEAYRRPRGPTGDHLSAGIEIVEAAVLGAMALIS